MATKTKSPGIPPDVMADMQAVSDALTSGKPLDQEVARRVRDRAEKARQELLATKGLQDIGVQIIREIRGDLPRP
ncbi:MAG TPA: hypothetical protein VGZ25_16215 [Gemmataceae bacterium]|jgi:hypothetical protein|nr:hypothetical protein [Gemmataceae bacterium]